MGEGLRAKMMPPWEHRPVKGETFVPVPNRGMQRHLREANVLRPPKLAATSE